MEKHIGSEKRFGKDGAATAARNETLEGFIRDKGRKAYALAHSLAGNEADARELVQEALYRVTRAWDRYEPAKPLDPWFFVVLRNAFTDGQRRFERRAVSLDLPLGDEDGETLGNVIPDGGESIQTSLEREEANRAVRRALNGMRQGERAVLTLCDMQGRRYDDVARRLGVPLGTARTRIYRARQALRTQSPELAALAQ